MKKFIFLLSLSFGLLFIQAQTHMFVNLSNGTVASFPLSNVDSVSYGTPPSVAPSIYTLPTFNMSNNSAQSGGNITNNGGSPIIESGVCWSLNNPPTTSDSVELNPNLNNFYYLLTLNNLQEDSLYFVRAFATNSTGTSYGQLSSFIAKGATYNGTMSGNLEIPAATTDTTFTNVSTTTVVQQTSPTTMNISFDLSSLLGIALGTLLPDVDGTLNGTTLTITNQVFVYQGILSFTIDGTIEFDCTFENILNSSTLTYTGDIMGTYNLNGVKQ